MRDALNLFTARKRIGHPEPRPASSTSSAMPKYLPSMKALNPTIGDIGTRAISSLTKYQGVGDLYRIYLLAQRDGIDYNLAFIPVDFNPKRTSEFDTKYMNEEFEMAYNLARSGYKWSKYPPGFEPANPKQLQPNEFSLDYGFRS